MTLFRKKALVILPILISSILLINYLFLDNIIKSLMTSTLSTINRAPVVIDDVSVSVLPLTITGYNMAFVDKDNQDHYWVTADKAIIALDFLSLLQKTIIIETIRVTGLQTNVNRDLPDKLPENFPENLPVADTAPATPPTDANHNFGDLINNQSLDLNALSGTIREKLDQYSGYYNKIKPFINRDKSEAPDRTREAIGSDIDLASSHQPPKFWLKDMTLAGKTEAESLAITARNITSDQEKINQPTTVSILNQQSDAQTSITATVMNQTTTLDLYATDPDYSSPAINQAALDTTGHIVLQDDVVRGDIQIIARGLQLNTDTKQDDTMRQVLASINQTNLSIALDGTINQPEIRLATDLGEQIQRNLARIARETAEQAIQAEKERIKNQVDAAIQTQKQSVNESLEKEKNKLDDLLKNQFNTLFQ